MKNKYCILVAFGIIAFSMWCVWEFAYKPNFSTTFSSSNVEWGGFGDFFWGLGTMLLTALNVYMVYNINTTIEHNRRSKDKYEIEKEVINEYKSFRDICITRVTSNIFRVDPIHIAPFESFIREIRRYENIFPFLRDNRKRESLNILQERLRLLQDQNSFDEWKNTHTLEEWDSFNGAIYLHSELILGYMIADWSATVNESLNTQI